MGKKITLPKEDLIALLPSLFIFSILFLPFVGLVPYMDGDVEFLIALNFYQGKYLTNWMPYHPPLKLFLSSLFFKLFGFSSYSLLGYLLGIIGIIALYFITKTFFDKKTAIISTLLLSLSGIYISAGIFSVNDFLLTVFLLCSLAFYVKKKYVLAAILACFTVLSKESGIIFPVTILLVEAFQRKFRIVNLLPFFALAGWFLFLHLTGHTLWNSWNFSDKPQSGSFFTVINNVIGGKIFNKYAYQNWLHLFIFNYNWVLWIFAFLAIGKCKWNEKFSILLVFSVLYSLIILSFQTYSIPRYVLPILPLLYIFVSVTLTKTRFQFIFFPLIFICVLLSLFTSADPISNKIWTKYTILNEKFYNNKDIDGNDGITYNMQFLYLTQERNSLIHSKVCKYYINSFIISPDTLTALNISQCK